MLRLKLRRNCKGVAKSKRALLEAKLKAHPCWRGELSFNQLKKELELQPPFTYAVTDSGESYRYCLTYVSASGEVKRSHIRIYMLGRVAGVKNYGFSVPPCFSIDQFIPHYFGCPAEVCQPLK